MVNKKAAKKSPGKKAKAPKQLAVSHTNPNMTSPSPEFIADLTDVFKRHGWVGLPQHLSFSSSGGCTRVCPDGSIAVPKSIPCPGGITKLVCACPGEDPGCDN